MTDYVVPISQLMQRYEWQSSLVLPQDENSLMQFNKADRQLIIELKKAEGNEELTSYSITYAPTAPGKSEVVENSQDVAPLKAADMAAN